MFDLTLIKKNIAPIIRREIAEVEKRYASMCVRVDDMIINDLSIPREDVAQRQWDLKQNLLNEIYQPYKDELLKFIAVLNRFHQPAKNQKLPKEIQQKFEILWNKMFTDYANGKWNNTDWNHWKKTWLALMIEGVNSELNNPRTYYEEQL